MSISMAIWSKYEIFGECSWLLTYLMNGWQSYWSAGAATMMRNFSKHWICAKCSCEIHYNDIVDHQKLCFKVDTASWTCIRVLHACIHSLILCLDSLSWGSMVTNPPVTLRVDYTESSWFFHEFMNSYFMIHESWIHDFMNSWNF